MSSASILRTYRALVEEAVQVGPANQGDILLVAAVGMTHCNADGSRWEVGMRTLARESDLYHGRTKAAVDWLIDNGWLRFERTIDRGGRRFTFTNPQRSGSRDADEGASVRAGETLTADASFTENGQRSEKRDAERVQRSGQRSGSRDEPPTSDFEREKMLDAAYAKTDQRIANGHPVGDRDSYALAIVAKEGQALLRPSRRSDHRDPEQVGHGDGVLTDW